MSGIPDPLHSLDLFTGVVGFTRLPLVLRESVCVSLLSVSAFPPSFIPNVNSLITESRKGLLSVSVHVTLNMRLHSIILFPFKHTTLYLDIVLKFALEKYK